MAANQNVGNANPAVVPYHLSNVVMWKITEPLQDNKQERTISKQIALVYMQPDDVVMPDLQRVVHDKRIVIKGMEEIEPGYLYNEEMLQDQLDPILANQVDAIHTYAAVRKTLTMYQQTQLERGRLVGSELPFAWKTLENSDEPINVINEQL